MQDSTPKPLDTSRKSLTGAGARHRGFCQSATSTAPRPSDRPDESQRPSPIATEPYLHDLEHLKLLYNSILRDRKLLGPAWKRQKVQYREIPGKLCSLAAKIQQLKQRLAGGESRNVDYYALMGLRRGCSRSEFERAAKSGSGGVERWR
ncbi:hypothetical protein SASPL_108735 [Salvia splendens]|uniref:Uncharacterized protein n=1 Tax=Salvia splendens TaxID=180675 RepID=A0A8X9A6X1_SALSN|nr:hypothetical protein SASPL_108735 [Salvia splendens]